MELLAVLIVVIIVGAFFGGKSFGGTIVRGVLGIIFLISVTIVYFVYISPDKSVPQEVKVKIDSALIQRPEFPAYPVWWADDTVLAVGIIKKQSNHNIEAIKACSIAAKYGVTNLIVELYDITKIEKNDEWELIGKARC